MIQRALLVMAKRPFPGQTKTRLATRFSPQTAAQLYEAFLCDALALSRQTPGVTPLIAYAPATAEAYFRQLAPDLRLVRQEGTTLGQRLDAVLSYCLARGFSQAVAMNSDSPTLPPRLVAQAFAWLGEPTTDVVLGPCDDGGYYLIGWKRPHPRLVRDVEMSTPYVLEQTLAIAASEGIRVALLPAWYDVDDPADLVRLETDLAQMPAVGQYTRRFLQKQRQAMNHGENGRYHSRSE